MGNEWRWLSVVAALAAEQMGGGWSERCARVGRERMDEATGDERTLSAGGLEEVQIAG